MQSILRFSPAVFAACLLLVACDDKKAQSPSPGAAVAAPEPAITSENMSSELDKLEKEIDAQ